MREEEQTYYRLRKLSIRFPRWIVDESSLLTKANIFNKSFSSRLSSLSFSTPRVSVCIPVGKKYVISDWLIVLKVGKEFYIERSTYENCVQLRVKVV